MADLSHSQLRWRFFGGFGMVALVAVLAFVTGIIITILVFDYLKETAYATEGERVPGRITKLYTKDERDSKGRKQIRYWVHFTFQTKEGRAQSQSHTVNGDDYKTLSLGQQREVEYLRSDLSQSRIYFAPETKSTFHIYLLGLLALITGAAAFSIGIFGWRSASRQARLTLEGQAVPGEVIELVTRKGKTISYELHYRFVDPLGAEHTEKLTLPIKAATDWQPGEPIAVLVDELDPSQFVPDVYRQRGDDLPQG